MYYDDEWDFEKEQNEKYDFYLDESKAKIYLLSNGDIFTIEDFWGLCHTFKFWDSRLLEMEKILVKECGEEREFYYHTGKSFDLDYSNKLVKGEV